MKKNPTVFLEHILESILLIEEYAEDLSQTDFSKNFRRSKPSEDFWRCLVSKGNKIEEKMPILLTITFLLAGKL